MAAKTYQPAGYDTDLSDAEWDLLKPLIYPADARRKRGRWRDTNSARACLDAIRYVLKTGCQWSMLPKEFAPRARCMTRCPPGLSRACGHVSMKRCAPRHG